MSDLDRQIDQGRDDRDSAYQIANRSDGIPIHAMRFSPPPNAPVQRRAAQRTVRCKRLLGGMLRGYRSLGFRQEAKERVQNLFIGRISPS